MVRFIVDTDVIIDHLRGVEKAKEFLRRFEKKESNGFYSTITEAEIFSGKRMDSLDEQRKVGRLLGLMERVNVDSRIARKAGEIRRKYEVSLPDAIIAATAVIKEAKIATRNAKHYESIRGIIIEDVDYLS